MRTQIIPEQTVVEDIVSFEHHIGSWVRVLIGKGTVQDNLFIPNPNQVYEVVNILDKPGITQSMTDTVIKEPQLDYQELMSANPSWAPNKPGGVFRKEDLWHFVDLIRTRG